MIRYSLLRITIFFLVLLLLYVVTLRGWTLLITSALISLVVACFALRGPREQFATQIEQKVVERQRRIEEYRTAEDDD